MYNSNLLATAFLAVLMAGCAAGAGPTEKLQTNDTRECAQNFTYNGTWLTGQTFRTNQHVGRVTKLQAVERGAKQLGKEGWSVVNIDKDLGIVSASHGVHFGKGQNVPLTLSLDSAKNGVGISLTFSATAGLVTPVDTIKTVFCNVITAIAGQ